MPQKTIPELAAQHQIAEAITLMEIAITNIINASMAILHIHEQAMKPEVRAAFENFEADLEKLLMDAHEKRMVYLTVHQYVHFLDMLKLMKKEDTVFLIAQKLREIKEREAARAAQENQGSTT